MIRHKLAKQWKHLDSPANAFYPALMFQARQRDPLVFIGVVEGYPEIA
jgi:hypothetical protein